MKFNPPIEHELKLGVSLVIRSAKLDKEGRAIAEVQAWNGTLIHSDFLHTGKATARRRFIRTLIQRADLNESEIDNALLFLDGNLTTTLAESLEVAQAAEAQNARPSQATQLIELAKNVELFHTPESDAFATIEVADHRENWPVRQKGFKRWLMHQFYKQTKSSASSQAIQDAIGALEGKAIYEGPENKVYIRTAELDGKIYIDLANDKWEAVEITSTGWRIIAEPPVRFRRSRGMLALPYPVAEGSFNELRRFVNVANAADWALLCGWMVQSIRPRGPYPVLALHGEQGSSKSTLTKVLKKLLDPSTAPLKSDPREIRDLMIAATNGWLIALDNLSHISVWLSDALCRLATGGGFSVRELYSDAEEVLFEAQRPAIMNGIEELITRGDLLDRTIILYLPSIPEERKCLEADFWLDFEEARPRLLGALYSAVSEAMRGLPSINLKKLPRMADFAVWASAAETSLGLKTNEFIRAYSSNRESANDLALESSSVAASLRAFAEAQEMWCDTATSLLKELNRIADEETRKQRAWPKDGRSLSNKLRRLVTNLRAVGVDIEFDIREGRKGQKLIRLECKRKTASAASAQTEYTGIESLDTSMMQAQRIGADAADAKMQADSKTVACDSCKQPVVLIQGSGNCQTCGIVLRYE